MVRKGGKEEMGMPLDPLERQVLESLRRAEQMAKREASKGTKQRGRHARSSRGRRKRTHGSKGGVSSDGEADPCDGGGGVDENDRGYGDSGAENAGSGDFELEDDPDTLAALAPPGHDSSKLTREEVEIRRMFAGLSLNPSVHASRRRVEKQRYDSYQSYNTGSDGDGYGSAREKGRDGEAAAGRRRRRNRHAAGGTAAGNGRTQEPPTRKQRSSRQATSSHNAQGAQGAQGARGARGAAEEPASRRQQQPHRPSGKRQGPSRRLTAAEQRRMEIVQRRRAEESERRRKVRSSRLRHLVGVCATGTGADVLGAFCRVGKGGAVSGVGADPTLPVAAFGVPTWRSFLRGTGDYAPDRAGSRPGTRGDAEMSCDAELEGGQEHGEGGGGRPDGGEDGPLRDGPLRGAAPPGEFGPGEIRLNALHTAAAVGNADAIPAVLSCAGGNADVAEPRTGATALHMASARGHAGVVMRLLEAGACVNAHTRERLAKIRGQGSGSGSGGGGPPQQRRSVTVVASGDDDAEGDSSEDDDSEEGPGDDDDGVNRDDDGDRSNGEGARSSDAAAARDGAGQVDSDEDHDGGYAPLHFAAAAGHTDVVDALLKNGAAPDALTAMRRNALHLARGRGVVQILLGAGCDLTWPDDNGDRPVDVARTRIDTDTVAAMVDAGADAWEPAPGDAGSRAGTKGEGGEVDPVELRIRFWFSARDKCPRCNSSKVITRLERRKDGRKTRAYGCRRCRWETAYKYRPDRVPGYFETAKWIPREWRRSYIVGDDDQGKDEVQEVGEVQENDEVQEVGRVQENDEVQEVGQVQENDKVQEVGQVQEKEVGQVQENDKVQEVGQVQEKDNVRDGVTFDEA